jgi:hypothetical protein
VAFLEILPAGGARYGLPARMLETAANEGRHEVEGRLRKDGSRFWASVLDAIRTPEGDLLGYAKIARDITDRRAAREAPARASDSCGFLSDLSWVATRMITQSKQPPTSNLVRLRDVRGGAEGTIGKK